MYRLLLSITIGIACYSTSFAGYFDWAGPGTVFRDDSAINVSSTGTIDAGDVVQIVSFIEVMDGSTPTDTILGLTWLQVDNFDTSAKRYNFKSATSDTLDSFLTGLTTGGATGTDTVVDGTISNSTFALLRSTSSYSDLTSLGLDFDAANFGLTAKEWEVSVVAGMDGVDDFAAWDSVNSGQIDPDDATSGQTGYEFRFGFTVTDLYDDSSLYPGGTYPGFTVEDFDGGSTTASVGTLTDAYTIEYATNAFNQELKMSNLEFKILNASVPEPSSLAVVSLLALGATSVRRRRQR